MKSRHIVAASLCLALALTACQQRLKGGTEKYEDAVTALLKAERETTFRPTHVGFTQSVPDSSVNSRVAHRPQKAPADTITAGGLPTGLPDTGLTLEWEPLKGVVAESGELGYTYGTYRITEKSTGRQEQGTYATIWRKDKDDHWQKELDINNPGMKYADMPGRP